MKISIDKNCIEEQSLTVQQFFALISIANEVDFKKILPQLVEKGLVIQLPSGVTLTKYGNDILDTIILNSDNSLPSEEEVERLAIELKKVYPEGKKQGTAYYWAEGKQLIMKRLMLFFKKYGKFPNDKIIEATKRYVNSFNGEFYYMRLLKYFIFKEEKGKAGDIESSSELLNYIENSNQVNNTNEEWTITLK